MAIGTAQSFLVGLFSEQGLDPVDHGGNEAQIGVRFAGAPTS